jgi:hypothetical protein
MRTDLLFRVSLYLTLALATACLGFAEQMFVPWIGWFLVPVGLLMLAAFVLEGRWILPLRSTNLLGLAIAAGTLSWMVYMISRPSNQLLLAGMSVLGSTLPFFGPVLMVLLLAKLFRPKGSRDFWGLQLIGLIEVTLACILSGDPLLGALLVGYLLCGVWSLTLFYLHREQLSVLSTQYSVLSTATTPWRAWGLWLVGRWSLVVLGFGLLIFLLIPRPSELTWDPFPFAGISGKLQTGVEPGMDLNRTGLIEVSDELAFEVSASENGRPKLDLDREQRWRGETLDMYSSGRWQSRPLLAPAMFFPRRKTQPLEADAAVTMILAVPQSAPVAIGLVTFPSSNAAPFLEKTMRAPTLLPVIFARNKELPDLGPGQYFLTFKVQPQRAGGLFLADPVAWDPEPRTHPYIPLGGQGYQGGQFYEMGKTLMPVLRLSRMTHRYRQVVLPAEKIARGWPIPFDHEYLRYIRRQETPGGIGEWTRELLGRLKGVTRADYQTRELLRQHSARIAQALTDHLASSGEFTYSLELRREDWSIDPIEDFLRYVKQGHCERYAAGLALMLRSLGIPARIVKGYRGAESQDEGVYYIRQSHAHSWVEAFVPYEGRPGYGYWLTLDPTPWVEAEGRTNWSWEEWWGQCWYDLQNAWRSFILDYTTEQQGRTAKGFAVLFRSVKRGGGVWLWVGAATVGVAFLLWTGRRLKRRFRSARAARPLRVPRVAFYARLLAVLARHCGLAPGTGQTPREFAQEASRRLRQKPEAVLLADVPVRAVRLFYRVRFGGELLSEAENQDIESQVQQLEAALGSLV